MRTELHTDIVIIGAGPAGSTLARRLAQLGHRVCLIERATFPRPRIGESLPPGILPVLDALGLRETVEEAGFLRPQRAIIHWAGEQRDKAQPGAAGFQVDRARFDQLLLDGARAAGVHILQPAEAARPQRLSDDRWLVRVTHPEGDLWIHADWVADASGKGGMLGRPTQRQSPPTLALFRYWRDVPLQGPETRVEASTDAWYWGAPLPGGHFNACVFIDPKGRALRSARDLEHAYTTLLNASPLLHTCLQGTPTTPVQACNASAYVCTDMVSTQAIAVGEAAFAIDPLSSQGVQAAMMSALQASIVIHTQRQHPQRARAAQTFYRERQAEGIARHAHWAQQAYAEQAQYAPTPFWQVRARPSAPTDGEPLSSPLSSPPPPRPDTPLMICPQTRTSTQAVIRGDLIEEIPALMHPSLVRPVAFLDDLELLPLLACLMPGESAPYVLARWQRFLPQAHGLRVLDWLWTQRILIPADGFSSAYNAQWPR